MATGTNIDGAGIRLSTPLYATGIANVQIANCSFTGNQGQVCMHAPHFSCAHMPVTDAVYSTHAASRTYQLVYAVHVL